MLFVGTYRGLWEIMFHNLFSHVNILLYKFDRDQGKMEMEEKFQLTQNIAKN